MSGLTPARQRRAQARVDLVDFSVRIDARVGFGDARVVEERRIAGVAGLRVDLLCRHFRLEIRR